jgi:hypothetical protein
VKNDPVAAAGKAQPAYQALRAAAEAAPQELATSRTARQLTADLNDRLPPSQRAGLQALAARATRAAAR